MKFVWTMVAALMITSCSAWGTLNDPELIPNDTMSRVLAAREATPEQKRTFGILAELPGRTFWGTPTEASNETLADVQRWSWRDDGKALIIQHALEDGSYGGETTVWKDEQSGELVYKYQTNAGFFTEGVYAVHPNGSWEAVEEVKGNSEITKVRSKGYLRNDGAMVSTSDVFSNGEWTPGHGFVYVDYDGELPELAPGSE